MELSEDIPVTVRLVPVGICWPLTGETILRVIACERGIFDTEGLGCGAEEAAIDPFIGAATTVSTR